MLISSYYFSFSEQLKCFNSQQKSWFIVGLLCLWFNSWGMFYSTSLFLHMTLLVESINSVGFTCENMGMFGLCYLCLITGLLVSLMEPSYSQSVLTMSLISVCFYFFVSFNLYQLFILFELSLFPIMLIIIIYGTQFERTSATSYMLIYTMVFSLPLLFMVWNQPHQLCYFSNVSYIGSILIILPFLVKFPIYFFHLWLPKAHVESPTFGSILLASLLLKLGTMGFLRMIWHMQSFLWYFCLLVGCAGMLFTSAICMWQSDVKSLIAYSSVCHMSLVLVGIALGFTLSVGGAVLMMLFHGTSSGLMFFISGNMYHSINSRKIFYISSALTSNLMFSGIICISLLLNFSVPPSASFFSEAFLVSAVFHFLVGSSVLLSLYILLVCYFTLFLLVSLLSGKAFISLVQESGLTVVFLSMSYNLLFLESVM